MFHLYRAEDEELSKAELNSTEWKTRVEGRIDFSTRPTHLRYLMLQDSLGMPFVLDRVRMNVHLTARIPTAIPNAQPDPTPTQPAVRHKVYSLATTRQKPPDRCSKQHAQASARDMMHSRH